MNVRLAYPNLYLSERLKDSPLLAQLKQLDVRAVVRPQQEVDMCVSDESAGMVYLSEPELGLAKAEHERLLAPLHKFTQSLVLVHKTKRTSAAFDKLQLRVTTRYGYTIVPVVNEAEAAKVISKMVNGRLRGRPPVARAIGKQTRPEPLDLAKVMTVIPGVGEQKAKALIAHFPTLRALANAGPEELGKVASIGPTLGQSVYDFFHDSFGGNDQPE